MATTTSRTRGPRYSLRLTMFLSVNEYCYYYGNYKSKTYDSSQRWTRPIHSHSTDSRPHQMLLHLDGLGAHPRDLAMEGGGHKQGMDGTGIPQGQHTWRVLCGGQAGVLLWVAGLGLFLAHHWHPIRMESARRGRRDLHVHVPFACRRGTRLHRPVQHLARRPCAAQQRDRLCINVCTCACVYVCVCVYCIVCCCIF